MTWLGSPGAPGWTIGGRGSTPAVRHDEQAAAGCQEGRDAGQGVGQVEMVQYGHHRDQISPAVIGR